jgi:hypothetical protein
MRKTGSVAGMGKMRITFKSSQKGREDFRN